MNYVTLGPKLVPPKRVPSLKRSVLNMQIAQHKIGSLPWKTALRRALLEHGFEAPSFAPNTKTRKKCRYTAKDVAWLAKGHGKSKQHSRSDEPKLEPRVERAVARLEACPGEFLFFITVVSAFGMSVEDTKIRIAEEALKLNRFMRRRFKHAKWLLFCELDEVLAKDVAADILPDPKWKDDIPGDMLLYKIHFHGVAYIPGKNAPEVEEAFKRTESGKISKMYRGNKQVRVLPLYLVDDVGKKVPDVKGVVGYSTKSFFKPPVPSKMFEGYPEWVDLTQFIKNNSHPTLIGGFNNDTFEYCYVCSKHFPMGHNCGARYPSGACTLIGEPLPETSTEDTVCEKPPSDTADRHSDPNSLRASHITLNSDRVTHGHRLEKRTQKKRMQLSSFIVRCMLKLWRNLVPARGP